MATLADSFLADLEDLSDDDVAEEEVKDEREEGGVSNAQAAGDLTKADFSLDAVSKLVNSERTKPRARPARLP